MHFVIIDLDQLHTRLCNSTGNHDITVEPWLETHGFRPSDNGWIASGDGMSSLSCTEILFSVTLDGEAVAARR